MPLLRAENSPSFQLPHLNVIGLAAPSRGATQTSVWRIQVAPGAPGVAHCVDREEIFVALKGSAVATLGGERLEIRAGDTLIVPPGEMFSLENPGPEEFDAVALAPVGVRARLPDGEYFSPPWSQ